MVIQRCWVNEGFTEMQLEAWTASRFLLMIVDCEWRGDKWVVVDIWRM